ncbi:type V CRISPR-associated protein Cas12a/Cpf1 [archaeon]|jgi:CRISPR-associated protein Cpf1|nr:type V CRISPR-associated protein Cas12a/Cpf1 [archaeon]MBT3838547.1 type V CRISPR-associated protein Cas12a/Cpf1 [Candidatus Neomarinimicrobiota bacterium]MBT7556558.1 type V CRISPR-associated protein Cas12a/Cpf1 [Candidatus Woesearchaeota archaeon]MBT3999250.1 type V CRISPR-associated protein Cas12a/Cpf1 [Candidatus Neomarinimicrobiota bacterium]MBT5070366.1 type V CRISPR-associated protein Cas12a/Cpf1 [Candidatus Neomarinimicrobiota bacterium]
MKLNKFTHQYPISKTLRFELKPVGETADYIEDFKSQYLKDIVIQDQQRAEDYESIKVIIDEYHRHYIEEKLSEPFDKKTGELFISGDEFENAFSYYQRFRENSKDEKARKEWIEVQNSLRKSLVKVFSDRKKRLFQKELITKELPSWLKEKGEWEDKKNVVENFNRFTTYFTGFNENRENMYSHEEQSTAISFRLMNENLPKYFNNCIQYHKAIESYDGLSFTVNPDLLNEMGVSILSEIFQPSYYIQLFTQSGIDKFTELLGGFTKENGEKVQGLNETINLFRQQKAIKAKAFPNFISLYKQILSDRETSSFIPDQFENDNDLLKSLGKFIKEMVKEDGLFKKLEDSIKLITDADLHRTFIKNGVEITKISQSIFGNYSILKSAIYHHAESVLYPDPISGKISEALKEKRIKYVNKQVVFSIAELETILSNYASQMTDDNPDKEIIAQCENSEHPIRTYFLNAIENVKNDKDIEFGKAIENVLPLISLENLNKGKDGQAQTHKIQKMLDAFLAVTHAVKPLHLVKGRKPIDIPDMDMGFYAEFSKAFENFEQLVITLYNKTRNHLTKKTFSTDKIKINFENPTLLDGWDANKEKDNSGVLFEKDGNYYLGIMHPKHKNIFNYIKGINDIESEKRSLSKDELFNKIVDGESEHYQKIVYKLLPGVNKMLPKVFFSGRRIDFFAPSTEVLKIRNSASHSKNGSPQKGFEKEDFNLKDCHTIIDFFKKSIEKHPEWKEFEFEFSPTSSYEDLSGFYREVEHQGYKMDFHPIKKSYIDQCIEEGKLFLFQIYNKDFSPYSKGKPNLHTLYWKALFDTENLKDVVAKLNGQAEIFYRKHSIKKDERTIHRANKSLQNKNENNPKKTSLFEYDIIKDRRYTVDKFQFHVPITLNFKMEKMTQFAHNEKVNQMIVKSENTHVIGIDRGERHLLYYSVINPKGHIVEQGTLNTISTDKGYEVDYQQKLDSKEKARDTARKSWTTVENIKELKAGYLSHVIHKIAFLIEKYNAIVCLEDLNFGFKRGRFKVEKQVYQKFEKALIDKLNYLVFKDAKPNEPGHVLNAFQLTAPFDSFKKLGKQTGLLYYVQASYTSKIDPVSGFINFLYPKYESLLKSKIFFESMDGIRYNADKDYFEFSFDYRKMTPNRNLEGYQTKWTACTFGEKRFKNIRNAHGNWESVEVNVTEALKKILKNEDVDFKSGHDLRFEISKVKSTKFYKKLFKLLQITLSLRHSKTGTDEDFILSPIVDENGKFFDSRNATKDQPMDADGNGAYHIALKGLWNLEQIRNWDGESRLNLAMKNVDWFSFAYQKPFKK